MNETEPRPSKVPAAQAAVDRTSALLANTASADKISALLAHTVGRVREIEIENAALRRALTCALEQGEGERESKRIARLHAEIEMQAQLKIWARNFWRALDEAVL